MKPSKAPPPYKHMRLMLGVQMWWAITWLPLQRRARAQAQAAAPTAAAASLTTPRETSTTAPGTPVPTALSLTTPTGARMLSCAVAAAAACLQPFVAFLHCRNICGTLALPSCAAHPWTSMSASQLQPWPQIVLGSMHLHSPMRFLQLMYH